MENTQSRVPRGAYTSRRRHLCLPIEICDEAKSDVRGTRHERPVQTPQKSVGLGGRQSGGQQYVKDENGVLLKDKGEILQRWAKFFSTLLNTKSPTLNQQSPRGAAMTSSTNHRRSVPLGSAPRLEETRQAVRGMHNWKAPGP